MHSQMNKPCFSSCSSKIKAASPLGSLKKFMIASTLPVLFCRRAGLLWKILAALARQPGVLSGGEPTKWECVRCRSVQYCGKYLSCLHASGFLCCKRLSTTAWKDHRSVAVPFLQVLGILSFLIDIQQIQDYKPVPSSPSTGMTTCRINRPLRKRALVCPQTHK